MDIRDRITGRLRKLVRDSVPTGDKRALIEDGKLEPPEEGPAEVKKDTGSIKSSFYGD